MKNKIEYEQIKKGIDIDLDDSIEDKFEIFSELINKDIELAKLFVSCFDILKINFDDFPKDFKEYLNEYDKIYSSIRKELKDYEEGRGFGDWTIEEKIKKIINLNRMEMIKFLEVFKKIFIE